MYRFAHEIDSASAKVADSAKLLGGGIKTSTVTDLVKLLQHPDRRVRFEAQFELVRRNEVTELMNAIRTAGSDAAKLHGLWGCWQHGLASVENANTVNALLFEILTDRTNGYSTELLTQTIKVMTDIVSRTVLLQLQASFDRAWHRSAMI